MLADPRATALVDNFAGQWLVLRNIRDVSPDADLFPDFDENLRDAFLEETALFFESQLKEDRSVVELLSADYTFVNERLARHYGIPNVYGDRFRRVSLDRRPARRTARPREPADRDVLSEPHVAGAAREVAARDDPRHAAAAAAARRAGAAGARRRREDRVGARTARGASQQPGVLGLPLDHGSARVRARELRPDRPLAHRGRRHAGRLLGRAAERRRLRGHDRAAGAAAPAAGPVRRQRHRKADGVRARPRHRVLRPAGGAAHRARRVRAGLPVVVDHSRHRQERAFQMRRSES